jgi:hypothetical protein
MSFKIGIITVSRTTNYGAELQAFALQYKLNQLGYNAEIIDYLYYKNINYIPTSNAKAEMSFGFFLNLKKFILYHILGKFIDFVLPKFHSSSRTKKNNFERFHKKFTKFSKQFRSINQLYHYNHNYDVYITGSDQVWNPSTFSSLKPYFLDFAIEGKKRIAYAASFGVSKVSDNYKKQYLSLFKKFNKIGVREKDGQKILKELGIDSEVVADPTLLLTKEDWSMVSNTSKIKIEHPYILIYDLHPSEAILEIAKNLKKTLNIPVYRICKRAFFNPKNDFINNIYDAGPAEFVHLFMNAKHVLTNSFHGTVFSCNLDVPFNVILNPDRKNNSRITNILNYLDLNDIIIYESENFQYKEIIYTSINDKLYQLRNNSISFLNKAINN